MMVYRHLNYPDIERRLTIVLSRKIYSKQMLLRSLVLTAFFWSFTISITYAQVLNVERFKITADTANVWSGSASFGFSIADQGTQELNLRNDANLTYFSEKHQYLLLNRINLHQVGAGTSSNGYFHLRSIFNRKNQINPESFLQFQYNFDLGLQRRALAGANVRYRFFETERFYGAISTGLMFENELWKEEIETETTTVENRIENNFLKSTTSLNLRGDISENISIVLYSYYQARPDRFSKPRVTADWQLQFQLRENLRFGMQFVATYDSDPILEAADFVYSFHNMLIFSF